MDYVTEKEAVLKEAILVLTDRVPML